MRPLSLPIAALSLLAPLLAQDPPKPRWKWRVDPLWRLRYDSNVFRLSKDNIDRFDEKRAADATSGRFRDIREVEDFLFEQRVTVTGRTKGWRDKDMTLELGVAAEVSFRNVVKNVARFDVSMTQDLGKGRQLAIEFEYDPEQFRRPYLFNATDLTGNVNASERVYRSGRFDDVRMQGEYRYRIWRRAKKKEERVGFLDRLGFEEIEGRVELGFGNRRYDHFPNRDRSEISVGYEVVGVLNGGLRVELSYDVAFLRTQNGREVLILDEPDFGVDFNGDSDTTDQNRRTIQRVDRSRIDHAAQIEVQWDLAKRWELQLGYAFVYQDYLSDERFDLNYNGRTDRRHELFGGLEWRFRKRWYAAAEFTWMNEDRDGRSIGDEDEEGSYNRYQLFLTVRRRF